MKTSQSLLALALLSGPSALFAPVSAPAAEALWVVFEIATSDKTSIPVEWVLSPGEDVMLQPAIAGGPLSLREQPSP
jgi:hypothetical protein